MCCNVKLDRYRSSRLIQWCYTFIMKFVSYAAISSVWVRGIIFGDAEMPNLSVGPWYIFLKQFSTDLKNFVQYRPIVTNSEFEDLSTRALPELEPLKCFRVFRVPIQPISTEERTLELQIIYKVDDTYHGKMWFENACSRSWVGVLRVGSYHGLMRYLHANWVKFTGFAPFIFYLNDLDNTKPGKKRLWQSVQCDVSYGFWSKADWWFSHTKQVSFDWWFFFFLIGREMKTEH